MRAEDFRLRNLVNDKSGNVFYISGLSLDIDDEYNELIGATPLGQTSHEVLKEVRELYWQPIPLTEDWLIKFGFDKFESYDFGGSLKVVPRFELNDISIQLSDSEFWYTRLQYDGGTSEIFEPVIEVKSIHQLQNLYFALTGEELKLN